jgi:dephospho-CoA kinase
MTSNSSKPFVVGLTGGVASGKTTAARAFQSREIPLIDTDELSREAVQPGSPTLEEIRQAFGSDVLATRGGLDRQAMRRRVFDDETARRRLEAILHPRIAELLDSRLAAIDAPWCVVAVPLLVEAGWVDRVDRVLVIDVPPEIQLARLAARDGIDEAEAQRMIDAQAARKDRLAVAHDVVDNAGDSENLAALVDRLCRAYDALASTMA